MYYVISGDQCCHTTTPSISAWVRGGEGERERERESEREREREKARKREI